MEMIALITFHENDKMEIDEIACLVCTTPEKLSNLITSAKGICVIQTLSAVKCDLSGYSIPDDRKLPEELQVYLSWRSRGRSEILIYDGANDPDKRLIKLGVFDE